MNKKTQNIKSIFILTLILFSLSITFIPKSLHAAPIYNARIVIQIEWSNIEVEKPIIPRDEIKEIDISVNFFIDTGESFGEGVFQGYAAAPPYAVIELEIIEMPSWCSAVLKQGTIITNFSKAEQTTNAVYITLDEDAPAYGAGYLKIKAVADPLGLIHGFEDTFTLYFIPSYLPIIKTDIPEFNTKRIDPSKNAVFPIELENAGNARTKVFLEVENVPEGWQATVTNEILLDEAGSKETAYLTVVPPKEFGYHYDEANIRVTMTPVRAENPSESGNPLYATFTVQNRGLSSNGMEQILFFGIIICLVLVIIVFILKWIRKRRA